MCLVLSSVSHWNQPQQKVCCIVSFLCYPLIIFLSFCVFHPSVLTFYLRRSASSKMLWNEITAVFQLSRACACVEDALVFDIFTLWWVIKRVLCSCSCCVDAETMLGWQVTASSLCSSWRLLSNQLFLLLNCPYLYSLVTIIWWILKSWTV